VDGGLRTVVGGSPAPLILAAVDYLVPIYRAANTHPRLLAEWISGNPEAMTPEQLHGRARPLVECHLGRAREAATARYDALRATDQTARDLETNS